MKPKLILKKCYEQYYKNIRTIHKKNKIRLINTFFIIIILIILIIGIAICYDRYKNKNEGISNNS